MADFSSNLSNIGEISKLLLSFLCGYTTDKIIDNSFK